VKVDAVLFDLDGTLADTAPDLKLALEAIRPATAPALDQAAVRVATAVGTVALLRLGLGLTPDMPAYETARIAFLAQYEALIGQATVLNPGMAEVLALLAVHTVPFGVVTNKPEALATRVLTALGLDTRAACLIGGDTTPQPKPHPGPLLEACRRLGVTPHRTIYVGDDKRDIEAAHAAGMPGLAAVFGYTRLAEARLWGADALLLQPEDLLAFIL